MKAQLLLTACFFGTILADSVLATISRKEFIEPQVGGGMTAVSKQFPYYVLITNVMTSGYTTACGGAVISNIWVLTFGYCAENIEMMTLLFGATNRNNTSEFGQVTQSFSGLDSEKFVILDNRELQLALIRLPHRLVFNDYIQAVKLPSSYPFQTFTNSPAVVSGYGKLYDTLQYRYGSIMDFNECRRALQSTRKTPKICMDCNSSGEVCSGQNGDPLVSTVTGELIGIGGLLSTKGYPSQYTSMVYFRDWIKENSGV